MQDYHAEFVEIYNKNITRPGADRLLNWLETTDFFTAPASTRFHGACECGLVMHSINVYNAMMQHFYTEGENAESYAICGLLHDLCKANFYKVSTRNVKNDATGQWEKVPFYQVADQLPYGHGEKSVYLIEHFMRLKTAEAIAIRWHMGGFDDAARRLLCCQRSLQHHPLAVKLHIADLTATYLMEQGTSEVEKRSPEKQIKPGHRRCSLCPGFAASPTPRRELQIFLHPPDQRGLGLRRRAAGDGKTRGNYCCGAELAQVFLAAAHATALVGAVGQQLLPVKSNASKKVATAMGMVPQ